MQPPSGGCVLKLLDVDISAYQGKAAAFGRLCVETSLFRFRQSSYLAAAFGRLCVETLVLNACHLALGRSRLRAAVC